MISIIKRFNTYEEISLINGQLGFCLSDDTLYIGKENSFISVSSDAASVGDLKEQVAKLREDADEIFVELNERAEKALELLGKAKDAKAFLDEMDEEIHEKIDEVDQRHIEENERINEILERPLMYKDAVPDYGNIEDTNMFDNDLTWISDKNGFVLITVKGICDFEVLINNKPYIRKVLGDDPNKSNLEVLFSQIYRISDGDVISIDEIEKTYATYTCQFIPHRTKEIGAVYREDQKDFIDLIYPVGSIYLSMIETNPSILFGKGNWNLTAPGRVLVGIDSGDTDFNESGKSGGAKTHTLTTAQMPSHTHTQNAHNHGVWGSSDTTNTNPPNSFKAGNAQNYQGTGVNQKPIFDTIATNQNTGGGNAHNNLQPYLTCYIWERIS